VKGHLVSAGMHGADSGWHRVVLLLHLQLLLLLLLLLLLSLLYVIQVTEVPPFSAEANAVLDKLAAEFSVEDALQVNLGSGRPLGLRVLGLVQNAIQSNGEDCCKEVGLAP